MEKIKEILKEKYQVELSETEKELTGQNSLITVLIQKPHRGFDYNYILNVATVSGFVDWVNSCAIEQRFRTIQGLTEFLETQEAYIYKQLTARLSLEYEEATH